VYQNLPSVSSLSLEGVKDGLTKVQMTVQQQIGIVEVPEELQSRVIDLEEKHLSVQHNLELLQQLYRAFRQEKESIDMQARALKELGSLLDRAKNA